MLFGYCGPSTHSQQLAHAYILNAALEIYSFLFLEAIFFSFQRYFFKQGRVDIPIP